MTGPFAAHPPVRPDIAGAQLFPLSFADLEGWAADDHAAAMKAFRRSCRAALERGRLRGGPSREALQPALLAACRAAADLPGPVDAETARRFFETWFVPHRVWPDATQPLREDRAGFATAYF